MAVQAVWVTENDMSRLNCLLHTAAQREEDTVVLSVLEDKLKQARIVHSRDLPDDVVTMNSCVRLLYSDPPEESECWLRFPENTSVPPVTCRSSPA